MNEPASSLPPRLLAAIRGPADVKALTPAQLPQTRPGNPRRPHAVTAKNGGHIGPISASVELTLALHRVFNSPRTGSSSTSRPRLCPQAAHRRGGEFFKKLRQSGGASGFLYRTESQHDPFGAGHAGTALSAAHRDGDGAGFVGTSEHVIAVCGDAAFTCGITLEA